jgi:hypothetical protein
MKKVILSIAFMLTAFVGFSQDVTHTVTIDLQNVMEIEPGDETATETLTFDAIEDYEDGVSSAAAKSFTFASNLDWTVDVKAAAANFTYTGSATTGNTMPASVLSVAPDGTTFQTLTTTYAAFDSGTAGADKTVNATYKANPGYLYAEGSYEMDVHYTITQE